MRTIILYFSGSGNTLAAAKKLGDSLGGSNIIPIAKLSGIKLSDYDRVGILFPVYGTHAPKAVLNQLKSVKFIPEQSVFILATYAGSRGYAVDEVRETIKESNSNAIQEFCVRMPGSSILEYGAFPMILQKKLIAASGRKLEQISEYIRTGKRTERINPNLLAVMFKNNGIRMAESYPNKGKLFYTSDKCAGCKKCIAICPVSNISYKDGRVVWGENCAQCMGCIQWCPNDAVNHPNLKDGRMRYHNPDISINDMLKSL